MDSDLLPARMVNEFVYCPRLFYLEWVEARFADNDDTRLGQQVTARSTSSRVRPLCPRTVSFGGRGRSRWVLRGSG